MSERKNFQGGIYCVIPMGKIYDESIRNSVHRRFYRLFGYDAKVLREKTLNQGIIYEIKKTIANEMDTLKYDTFKELRVNLPQETSSKYDKAAIREGVLEDIKDQIEQSYGFAIYHNGRNVGMYVAPFSGKTEKGVSRISDFFNMNKNKLPLIGSSGGGNTNNWNIVLAVAHNVAARFEAHGAYPDRMYKGLGKRVLLIWAQVISKKVREKFGRVDKPVQYGYILSRQGYEGKVFRSNDIAVV